ncbi:hypothetical protein MA16_Dca029136 [Dendrobium catenatum]|uniref:Uncharacterized protein n=1 Tax=Dendrobium catenatum TaxID=906689 RepID=A0A2I0V7D5_9ASPA|nr:hypothetical protein MA16_Dca029136 [Dendrobium catenatum]
MLRTVSMSYSVLSPTGAGINRSATDASRNWYPILLISSFLQFSPQSRKLSTFNNLSRKLQETESESGGNSQTMVSIKVW